jgi:uncharacterized membrane protein
VSAAHDAADQRAGGNRRSLVVAAPSITWRGAVKLLLFAAAALSLAGLGIATYLTVVHFADQPIVCSSIGDCELVNSSAYAKVAGVPVAMLGAGAYASLAALIAIALVRRSSIAVLTAWGIALAGVGFSGYLTYIELFLLDAICVYCIASACVMAALFASLSGLVWLLRGELFGENGDA